MSAAERNQSEREVEVATKPARRRFSLDYKRRIVREADGCKTPGAVIVRANQELEKFHRGRAGATPTT